MRAKASREVAYARKYNRDRAKREFVINSTTEIKILKDKYKITDDDKTVKPMFFKMITTENGYKLSDNMKYRSFNTTMDYLQKIISKFNFRKGREKKAEIIPFMDIVREPENWYRQGYYYSVSKKIISMIREANDEKRKLFIDYENADEYERDIIWTKAGEIKQNCIDEIDSMSNSPLIMYATLKELDRKECSDVARFVFEVLFGKPNESFFSMIKDSREEIYTLSECGNGEISLYGFKYNKIPIAHSQSVSIA